MPQISVVMSCFNAAAFITEAIESILNQTFADFELILIDDGSTDETLDIIKQYELKDSRIIVIQKENTGQTDSLNVGIQAAIGKWIARLDADDIALPTRLERQLAYVESTPNIVLLGTGCIEINASGYPIKKYYYPGKHSRLVKRLYLNKAFPPHSSFLCRADVVKRICGYNTRFRCFQDKDLWLRLVEQGEIACLDKPLVKIRKHSNNISRNVGLSNLEGTVALVCHFLRIHGVADPSAFNDDADWLTFTEWIIKRLKQEKVFERQQEWTQMRQAYYSAGNKLICAWRLMIGLATSKHAFRILHEKFCGSNLALKLADEWMKKNSVGLNTI